MEKLSGFFIAIAIWSGANAQAKIELFGHRIINNDTIPVIFSLTKNDTVVTGTARYSYGGKHFVLYNITGKIFPSGSVELFDTYIEDKFMPMGCDFYGRYTLNPSSDTSVLTGIWKEPGTSLVRKKDTGRLFLSKIQGLNTDSLLFTAAVSERRDSLIRVVHTRQKNVRVEITDNAEIDDDRISVFYNGVLIVKNQKIGRTPIVLSFELDPARTESVLKVVAESVGKIPPNTTRMRIVTGENDEFALVSSSFDHNGVIQFKLTQ